MVRISALSIVSLRNPGMKHTLYFSNLWPVTIMASCFGPHKILKFWRTSVLFVGPLISLFWWCLLWLSKARVQVMHAMDSQIHAWCWPLGSQHGSWAVWSTQENSVTRKHILWLWRHFAVHRTILCFHGSKITLLNCSCFSQPFQVR